MGLVSRMYFLATPAFLDWSLFFDSLDLEMVQSL